MVIASEGFAWLAFYPILKQHVLLNISFGKYTGDDSWVTGNF